MVNVKFLFFFSWKNFSGKILLILFWVLVLVLMVLLSSWVDMLWLSNGKLLIVFGFMVLVIVFIGMVVVLMLVNLKVS